MGLQKLVHSKRFWTALIGLVALIANDLHPGANVPEEAIVIVIGAVIGGYTVEDGINAARGKKDEKSAVGKELP